MTVELLSPLAWLAFPAVRATPLIPNFGSTEGVEKDQALVDNLRTRMGMKEEVKVVETPYKGAFEFAAFGDTWLPFQNSILIPTKDSDFWERVGDAKPFIYAHEITHIKNSDICRITLIQVVIHSAILLTLIVVMPVGCAIVASEVVAVASLIFLSRESERRADLDACKYLTDDEIILGIEFFENYRYALKKRYDVSSGFRNIQDWLFLTERGNMLLDIAHPPLTERISYLTEAIRDHHTRSNVKIWLENIRRTE